MDVDPPTQVAKTDKKPRFEVKKVSIHLLRSDHFEVEYDTCFGGSMQLEDAGADASYLRSLSMQSDKERLSKLTETVERRRIMGMG